jgi:xylulokinase
MLRKILTILPLLLLLIHFTDASQKQCFLGLDVGTQGTKCIAYCPSEQKVIARSSYSYELAPNNYPDAVPGRAEQDPQVWLEAVDDCLKKISHQITRSKYSIGGIGVSGQQHGLVALDDQGESVRLAKLWCDVEADEQAKRLQNLSKHIKPFHFLTAGFTSPKILWMKENEPDLFQKTRWIVLPHDFVTMKLAGLETPVTDAGDASGNGVFDAETRQHDPKLAAIIDEDLIHKLPKVLPPNAVAGYLTERYLKILRQPLTTKIPVSVGSGDNMCSALGVGCVKPGQAVMSLGTSGTIFGVASTPAPTNTPLSPFCDATGRHLPLACTMSCTGVLQHVLKYWCKGNMTHETASRLAASVPIGCLGVIFLPYLGGERTPNWPHASGALLGLTMHNFQDPAVLYRACLEGITFVLADALQHFGPIERLFVVGGGSKNHFWCQMIADVVGCELVFPIEPESAALGAAFQAGAAACGMEVDKYVMQQDIPVLQNTVKPIPENGEPYREAFTRYRMLSSKLFQDSSSTSKTSKL